MTTGAAAPPLPPVVHAYQELQQAWERMLSAVDQGGLGHFDDLGLLSFMQDHEQFRNRTALLDHHLVAAIVERDMADELCQPNAARVLTSRLLISNVEARRRVAAAEAVGPRRSALGQSLEPVRSVLAAAQTAGAASTEQVDIITRALTKVSGRGFDQTAIDDGEALLADFAGRFGPEDLRRLGQQVVDGIDPDGKEPDGKMHERRSFELNRHSDNTWRCTGRLTAEAGIQLNAFLSAHAKPRPAVPDLPAGPGTSDERSYPQRMHDALADLAARGLREGTGAQTTAGAATVIITINADDLLDRVDNESEENAEPETPDETSSRPADKEKAGWRLGKGHGVTSDGTIVSVADLAVLASEAEIIPVWMSSTGEVLDLGRTRRCASRQQTLALVARDVGCSFPGCDRPPEWCERHHILSWLEGGKTDIDNLTLLCCYHHHNFEQRGWTCRINTDGLPEWTAPRWLDRAQKPLLNSRIAARSATQKGSDACSPTRRL